MTFQGMKKGAGAFVVSLSTVVPFSSLKATNNGGGMIDTPAGGERLQQARTLQKTLPNAVLSLKAQAK